MAGNSTTSVIIILLLVVVLTAGTIVTLGTRVDNVSQQEVQKMVDDFVAEVANTGTLTRSQYQTFQNQLNAKTGKNCDIALEAQILDENPGKKTAQANYTKIGENVYYSVYTSQIEDALNKDKAYYCKEGDIVSVSIKNTNQTMSQQLKNFFYTVTGNDSYTIAAEHAGVVTANGN